MSLKAKHEEPRKSVEAVQCQLDQINEILRRVDALPSLDTRPEDEILGY